MNQTNILTLVLLSLILSGCAVFDQLKPQTPREALVVAEYAYQGVVDTVGDLARSGLLTPSERTSIIAIMDKVEVTRKAARAIILAGEPGSETEVIDAYTVALSLLLDLARQYAVKYAIEGE